MRQNRRKIQYTVIAYILIFSVLFLSGCGIISGNQSPLNPEEPVTIRLWHYYSGKNKEKFDQLVSLFNETEGIKKGIVIDAQSQGDVGRLAEAVYDAANQNIGSQPIPNIFAAYPDNAYRVDLVVPLVELETYFSKEELEQYRDEFLEEGRFGENNRLKIMPIAKSTENLFLNKTFWDEFAKDTGAKLETLSTWEGIIQTAEIYYEWSGGKAFLGIDGNANYMLVSASQLGEELFHYDQSKPKFNFDSQIAKIIWDSFYIPYLKGYFVKTGRFSSDDAKIGNVIAYIGSTAGAAYFPSEVTISENEVYPIEPEVLAYPKFKSGQASAVQQGAGMCIVESDLIHEYASAEFLKWFTMQDQNVSFSVSTAYFPVKKDSLREDLIMEAYEQEDEFLPVSIKASIKTTMQMFDEVYFYGYKPFEGSIYVRDILENHLISWVQRDQESLKGLSKEQKKQEVDKFLSEENFNSWYDSFLEEIREYLD